METLITPMTEGQKDQIEDLLKAVVRKAGLAKNAAQLIIMCGDQLQAGTLALLKRLSQASKAIVLPPHGGKLHFVSVFVDESRPWDKAVRSVGPNTPDRYKVWNVADRYPPQGESGVREIILVNFGRESFTTNAQALAWGKENRLRPASPRGCFAIGEHYPTLNRELGMNYMVVVSPDSCSFRSRRRVCNVWWHNAERGTGLGWFADGYYDESWFAFVHE